MGLYSIKELEQLSGVKAHTIRIWEQRYGLLNPSRTDTNIRTYDDRELKHLLNVSLLTNHGYKISKVSSLSREQVKEELDNLMVDSNVDSLPLGDQINGLILAMLELDEYRFNDIFSNAKQQMSFEALVVELFYPFLRKVGIMWGIDQSNPAQEHFISNLIRRKILAEVDKIPLPSKDAPSYVLALREGELHEMGLLLTEFVMRSRGMRTHYLGQNVPVADILHTAELASAKAIVTFFVKPFGEDGQSDYLENLSNEVEIPIFYNSFDPQEEKVSSNETITYVSGIQSLMDEIAAL